MKKYKVNVNGTNYEIGIELMSEEEAAASKAAAPAAAPAAAQAAPIAPAAASGEGEVIACPMPGTILDVRVSEGQQVKSGDILMILEAMKMENEIMAPKDGIVTSVIAKGASVQTGTALFTIK